jgi:hypothetical protein
MRPFQSNDDFFAAVRALIARLEAAGQLQAAAELREGFGCLNGLTDGAAMFLEAIDRVRGARSREFERDDRDALEHIRKALRQAVRRR